MRTRLNSALMKDCVQIRANALGCINGSARGTEGLHADRKTAERRRMVGKGFSLQAMKHVYEVRRRKSRSWRTARTCERSQPLHNNSSEDRRSNSLQTDEIYRRAEQLNEVLII